MNKLFLLLMIPMFFIGCKDSPVPEEKNNEVIVEEAESQLVIDNQSLTRQNSMSLLDSKYGDINSMNNLKGLNSRIIDIMNLLREQEQLVNTRIEDITDNGNSSTFILQRIASVKEFFGLYKKLVVRYYDEALEIVFKYNSRTQKGMLFSIKEGEDQEVLPIEKSFYRGGAVSADISPDIKTIKNLIANAESYLDITNNSVVYLGEVLARISNSDYLEVEAQSAERKNEINNISDDSNRMFTILLSGEYTNLEAKSSSIKNNFNTAKNDLLSTLNDIGTFNVHPDHAVELQNSIGKLDSKLEVLNDINKKTLHLFKVSKLYARLRKRMSVYASTQERVNQIKEEINILKDNNTLPESDYVLSTKVTSLSYTLTQNWINMLDNKIEDIDNVANMLLRKKYNT